VLQRSRQPQRRDRPSVRPSDGPTSLPRPCGSPRPAPGSALARQGRGSCAPNCLTTSHLPQATRSDRSSSCRGTVRSSPTVSWWADTISLADWRFTASVPALRVQRDSVPLTLTAERRGARVVLTYVFFTDQYRFQVQGHVTGLGPAGAVLLVGMGDGLRSVEADTMD